MLRLRTFAIVSVIAAAFTLSAAADTITWLGPDGKPNSDGNWSDPNNWNPAQVPGAGDTAILPAVTLYTPGENATPNTRTITVDTVQTVAEVQVPSAGT